MPVSSKTPIADLIVKLSGEGKSIAEIVNAVAKVETASRRSNAAGFDQFWQAFPNRVGKGEAEKAFQKAVRLVSLEVLLDGVMRYAAKRDDRPWCNPATWLNQKRWEDEEPAPVMQLAPARGIAAVRQRLEQEISHGRYGAPAADRGFGDYADRGLPLLDQRK